MSRCACRPGSVPPGIGSGRCIRGARAWLARASPCASTRSTDTRWGWPVAGNERHPPRAPLSESARLAEYRARRSRGGGEIRMPARGYEPQTPDASRYPGETATSSTRTDPTRGCIQRRRRSTSFVRDRGRSSEGTPIAVRPDVEGRAVPTISPRPLAAHALSSSETKPRAGRRLASVGREARVETSRSSEQIAGPGRFQP